MILLDTNVLMYAAGGAHPLRDRCARLLDAQASGTLELGVTFEVLQEFAHASTRRRPRRTAVDLARLYSEALTVVDTTLDDFDRGLEIFMAHPPVGAFDAVIAAVALHHEAPLVSADRAFAHIAGLRHVDPATPDLDRLIRSRE